MKQYFCIILLFPLLAGGALVAQTPPPPDVITLATGASVTCRVLAATSDHLTIEYRAGGSPGLLKRDVSWTDVKTVDFAMDEEFRALLAAKDLKKEGPRLQARWEAATALLDRPNHPAGGLGLVLARLMGQTTDSTQQTRALEICATVENRDWNTTRRSEAKFIRAGILASIGQKQEAASLLAALVDEPNPDPKTAANAHLALASLTFESLKALEQEHPRWEEDDSVRPERERLFHEAVDHGLRPSLFYGALEEASATGLWRAAEMHTFNHDLVSAGHCALDVVLLYPNSAWAARARDFLTQNQLPTAPPTTTPAPKPKPTTEGEKPGATPPTTPVEPQVMKRQRLPKAGEKPATSMTP